MKANYKLFLDSLQGEIIHQKKKKGIREMHIKFMMVSLEKGDIRIGDASILCGFFFFKYKKDL